MSKSPKQNRLKESSSPYLLQHANNPVDWYPWGDEAFEKARTESKPIFLSIGYSSCHWCHVMERESFTDDEVAKLLNQHFVSIKVDREERPDIDDQYMLAVQLMTDNGGWPMSAFLTPELKPFFGGTYFKKDMFVSLLENINTLWETERENLIEQGDRVVKAMLSASKHGERKEIHRSLNDSAVKMLEQRYDSEFGGFGDAQKFPDAPHLLFLIYEYYRTSERKLAEMVLATLDNMMCGGIRDHIGGGFHRYAVERTWTIPHFEKMLYDQAQISLMYLYAYELTETPEYRHAAEEILDFVIREMTSPEGGFYSAIDADSGNAEGNYYTWTKAEIEEALPKTDADLFCSIYDIRDEGNFEGTNVVRLKMPLTQSASDMGKKYLDIYKRIRPIHAKLLNARNKREKPRTDDKIITSWNGLMIAAFAKAGILLDKELYIDTAQKAIEYILNDTDADGPVYRCRRSGKTEIEGFLEDYAYLAWGLITMNHYNEAVQITKVMLEKFWDESKGGFFTHKPDGLPIPAMKNAEDNALPSANGVAAQVLALMGRMDGEPYKSLAKRCVSAFGETIGRYPSYFGSLLIAADMIDTLNNLNTGTESIVDVSLETDELVVGGGQAVTIRIVLDIRENWHLNAHGADATENLPTDVNMILPEGWYGSIEYPEPIRKLDDNTPALIYTGCVTIHLNLTAPSKPGLYSVPIQVTGQACGLSSCAAPHIWTLEARVSVV